MRRICKNKSSMLFDQQKCLGITDILANVAYFEIQNSSKIEERKVVCDCLIGVKQLIVPY